MSLLDRLLATMAAAAAVPLFAPDRSLPRARPGLGPATPARVGAADGAFAVEAMELGKTVITLSRVVADAPASEPVRAFAQAMLADHGAADAELARLAAAKHLSLPLAAGATTRAQAEQLAAMTEDAREDAYVRRMIDLHEQAVRLYRQAHKEAEDADLADYAGRRRPLLEDHLAAARRLAEGEPAGKHGKGRKNRG